ncbi:hypothetical protein DMENIID0001_024900 [Sergentomyia squamirostris]
MYRVNLVNQVPPPPQGAPQQQQQLVGVLSQMDGGGNGGGGSNGIMVGGLSGGGSSSAASMGEDAIMTAVKVEPMHDTASTSSTTNGHMVYTTKRPRLEGDDWLSSPSPGSVPSSAPPLSPSPGSQSHNYNNISNGYPSPMSTGSYDPYSPNGKIVHWDYDRSVCARTVDHRKCYWIFRDIARTSLGHHQDITRTPTVFSSV